MKVFSQKRETKSYIVDPYVSVTNARFCVRVDQHGVVITEFSSPKMDYSEPLYRNSVVPLELFQTALEEWEKVK